MVVHHLIYPLSAGAGIRPAIFNIYFSALFVFGVFSHGGRTWPRRLILLFGATTLATGLANAYAPPSPYLGLALYLSVIPYHGVMIWTLVRFTFSGQKVLTETVLAATTLYLVIGSVFTAIYGVIEWIVPGSFTTPAGGPVEWQEMLYFSFVTLTTLGFGDITPAKYHAQAFVTFEAVVGVLYTVILLSRLVGLHETRPTPPT